MPSPRWPTMILSFGYFSHTPESTSYLLDKVVAVGEVGLGGEIRQVSRDHTEVQELVDSGTVSAAEARNWPRRNVITRAVGIFDEPELDLVQGELKSGDTFVLCSDGLTGPVEDAEIHSSIASRSPQAACDALIDMALERGASDNVTVIVVRCMAEEAAVAAPVSGEAA